MVNDDIVYKVLTVVWSVRHSVLGVLSCVVSDDIVYKVYSVVWSVMA